MIRVLHVITDLKVGGAQTMLLKLIENGNHSQFEHVVISLMDLGVLGERLRALGVEVIALGGTSGYLGRKAICKLGGHVRRLKPHVIQGWMYHGNLAAWLARLLSKLRPRLIWGIRQSLGSFSDEKWMTRVVIYANIRLSRCPDAIIFNAQRACTQHVNAGMHARSCAIIPNGFDTQLLNFSPSARIDVRSELGLSAGAIVVGLIGRFHPMKDHAGFLRAASEVLRRNSEVHFLLAGDGVSDNNEELSDRINALRLSGHVHMLGRRKDIPRLTAALDVAVSASARNEGFSNAIGEAMSCGIPCVVTDVGDSAQIVSVAGRVVPPGDPTKLADAICELLALDHDERLRIGRSARERVISEFSIGKVVGQFETLYVDVIE